jgi:peptide/nickel transport system ATP-binding protein
VAADPARPLLEVDDLRVVFKLRRGLVRSVPLPAVDGVSFHIGDGETVGLVGESGSGKSTTGRGVMRLIEPTSGTVTLDGQRITDLGRRELRAARRHMQMVFQDPYSSLDPAMTIGDTLAEPLRIHDGLRGREAHDRVVELLEQVGMARHHVDRYPYEFSGGQRQRIAIARAIAVNPKLVVCDEAVSALDVSTQNQVINLLEGLRDTYGLSYLFISHDLAVVRHISHRVIVLYLGRVVEEGPAERLYLSAAHPYTEALLSAVPVPDPVEQRRRRRIVLTGDMPDPTSPPPGCAFHTRCPYVMDVCRQVVPEATPVDGGGTVRCHLQTTGPTLAGGPVGQLAAQR